MICMGCYATVVIIYANLGRYMKLEDLGLGLDDSTMHEIARASESDIRFLIANAVLVGLGLIALVMAAINALRRSRQRIKH